MARRNVCDTCGGNLLFSPDSGLMECEHCGNAIALKKSKSASRPLTRRYSETYTMTPTESTSQTYLCSSCGATVSFEETEVKKRCPSCGDISLNRQQRSIYVPDAIIPFVVSRDKAISIFREWIGSRKFAPNNLKQMAKLGKISGLYIPAWNFSFRLVVGYNADVTRTEERNDQFFTKHFYVDGVEEKTFANVLLTANKRISNQTVDELEPFDASKMIPYSNEYVFGFSGLDTDLDIHESFEEVRHEKENALKSKIRSNLKEKYETIEKLDTFDQLKGCTFSHTYVPVWANHYTYNGKQYHCYINGQTGKATGKAPKSFWKIFGLIGGIVGAIALAAIIIF
ncbi:MAG: hypothetical protein IJW24_02240 [Clostridia bacterium]|nr:hypothetical protein [Clostridia bacterium]